MEEKKLRLLLMPGMDGTGELFAEFVRLLPGWIELRVVSYPRDRRLSYGQLLPIVKSALQTDEPFVILAESFSTPLAVEFAAETPKGLQALILCAGFISPPLSGLLRRVALILAPALFSFGLPQRVCRYFLVGNAASKSLVDSVRATISRVPSGVLAHRLRSVLTCSGERELQCVSVPLLYISGLEDRLVHRSSFHEIQRTKPDALFASVEAPHLILQAKPHQTVDVVVRFLQRLSEPSQDRC